MRIRGAELARGELGLGRSEHMAAATNPLQKSAIGYKPTALEESLQKALIGASRRPLSSTFASDEVERQKIERFFLA